MRPAASWFTSIASRLGWSIGGWSGIDLFAGIRLLCIRRDSLRTEN
jgi:hypothetical protein